MQEPVLETLFPGRWRILFEKAGILPGQLREIRMRAGKPLLLLYGGRECGVTAEGALTGSAGDSVVVSQGDVREMLEYLSGYSMYAFDEEMRQGYFTVPGGHRIGLAGHTVADGDRVQCVRHISFLNIRFAHQVRGCADVLMPYLMKRDGTLCHTLLVSPPGCGKTTMLRDVIRQISDGTPQFPGAAVGVVDERSEIAGSYLGVPQNDLGMRTDVLDGCPKSEGMMMLLRAMSPKVIAVDEIGNERDGCAIESVFHCGCRLLATAHGDSLGDIAGRPLLGRMMQQKMFERYVVLDGGAGVGKIKGIFDGEQRQLLGGGPDDSVVQDNRDLLHPGGVCAGRAGAGTGNEEALGIFPGAEGAV